MQCCVAARPASAAHCCTHSRARSCPPPPPNTAHKIRIPPPVLRLGPEHYVFGLSVRLCVPASVCTQVRALAQAFIDRLAVAVPGWGTGPQIVASPSPPQKKSAILLTHCRQLILRKSSKSDATRCQVLKLKCTKFDFRWGSAPDPAGELIALPRTPSCI